MVQIVRRQIAENLAFAENSNFIWENTEAVVDRGCSGISL